jgi:hypothetical protein
MPTGMPAQQAIDASLFATTRPLAGERVGPVTGLDKTLRALVWPAYGIAPNRDPTIEDRMRFGRDEEFVLAGERVGFLSDIATTELGLRMRCREADPLNTLFGNRNQLGVLSSMTAWELGSSYASVAVPRWLEHTRYRTPARIAAIVGESVFAVQRVRVSIRNFQSARQAGSHPGLSRLQQTFVERRPQPK